MNRVMRRLLDSPLDDVLMPIWEEFRAEMESFDVEHESAAEFFGDIVKTHIEASGAEADGDGDD